MAIKANGLFFQEKEKRLSESKYSALAESHVPCFQERVGTRHPRYMIPDRLPWRLRARPSATLHEIQVRSEKRTCCCDDIEPSDSTSRGNSFTTKGTKVHEEILRDASFALRWKCGYNNFDGEALWCENLSFRFWNSGCCGSIPPPPRSSEIIDLRGDDRQNLLLQRIRGKILRTKELTHSGFVHPLLLSPWQ